MTDKPLIECENVDLADIQAIIREVAASGALVGSVFYNKNTDAVGGSNLTVYTDNHLRRPSKEWRQELLSIATSCYTQFQRCNALDDENNQKSARNFKSMGDAIHRILGTGLGDVDDNVLLKDENGEPVVMKDGNGEVLVREPKIHEGVQE